MTLIIPIELDEFLTKYRRTARRIKPARDIPAKTTRPPNRTARRKADTQRTPQAVCKLISKLKHQDNLRRALDYISQSHTVELIDKDGNPHTGHGWGTTIAKQWADQNRLQAQRNGKKQRRDAIQAVHLIFSSPKGTLSRQNESAARALLKTHFPDHDYMLAQHTDTKNLHAHVVLNNVSHQGKPLSWRKQQLLKLRASWAYQQQQHGVNVTCSPRTERAQFTPALAMPQVKARARGEPLHFEKDERTPSDNHEWLIRQLDHAYTLYIQLHKDQQRLQDKQDAHNKALKKATRERIERLIERTRSHLTRHRDLQLPDWLKHHPDQQTLTKPNDTPQPTQNELQSTVTTAETPKRSNTITADLPTATVTDDPHLDEPEL